MSLFPARSPHNIPVVDGIRAIAVLWVIVFHAWLFQLNTFPEWASRILDFWPSVWISKGGLGVDLFFAISGFLIGGILFRELNKGQIEFKRFYIRRFFRLIPVYVFAILLGFAFDTHGDWKLAWTNLLYINNYVRGSFMPWCWSLAIEEQLYLVVPFLLSALAWRRNWTLPGLLLLAAIPIALTGWYRTAVYTDPLPLQLVFVSDAWLDWFWEYYMLTHFRFGGLVAGVIAAWLHENRAPLLKSHFSRNPRMHSGLVLLSILGIVAISSVPFGQWYPIENSVFSGIPASVGVAYEVVHRDIFCYFVSYLIVACIHGEMAILGPLRKGLGAPWLYPIAQVSYSAYLFHEMWMIWMYPKVTEALQDSWHPVPIMMFNFVASLVIILVAAYAMYRLIELPSQRYKNRLTSVPSAPKTA